jgi:hypothetical protein
LLWACSQPLPMQQNLPKSALDSPKLSSFAEHCPKRSRFRNFEIPPIIEILIFFKKINYTCRRGMRVFG